jgi:hypothetical protein
MNYYEDPLGQVCQRIMTILTCIVMLLALSVYYCFASIKRAIFAIFFKAQIVYINIRFMLKKTFYIMYFYLCKMWDRVYWYLKPTLTNEDVERMKAKLGAIIEDKQHCDDPGVAATIANARAILQQVEGEQTSK